MKHNKMICWVTKTHKKKIINAFLKTHNLLFTETFDELLSYKNCIIIISLSKITNQYILKNIGKLNNPYFLEKKGWITLNMTKALESSKNHFMIGLSDIHTIISGD